ncbi:telomere-protecting terminal protein Tpg [Streptomyces sp. NPDC100445]|uniref:telomere-protecting terminal protein Tpg n=1 Tax=Streptomyces sp. NPDC100445 TaxID=3366102 RepID=UPI0037FD5C5E
MPGDGCTSSRSCPGQPSCPRSASRLDGGDRPHGVTAGWTRTTAVFGWTRMSSSGRCKDQIRRPRADLAQRLADAVRARWQPRIREQARRQAATSTGLVIDTRAQFGFTAAPGTTDDARLRHLTLALPPDYAARVFDAQQARAGEQQLRGITAKGLAHVYFRDGGRRAQELSDPPARP